MARRYVNPNRPGPNGTGVAPFDARVAEQFSIPPGMVDDRARAAYRLLRARDAGAPGDAPGAVLDGQPWAKSWGAFLGALRSRDESARLFIAQAWSERLPGEGGFLVPENLRQQVLAYLARQVIYPRCMRVPVTTLRTGVPALDNTSQASGAQALAGITFGMVEGGAAFPASSPMLARLALEVSKAGALIQGVPNELLDDAAEAFGDLLARVIALGYGWFVDDLAFNGTGAGEPEGLLNSLAAVNVTRDPPSGLNVGHADVVAMVKALHPASKETATWLISNDLFGEMLALYEVVGTAPSGQDVPPPGSLRFNSVTGHWELLGLTALATDHQPAAGTRGDLILCDLSLFLLAERELLTVELSAAGSGFATGTTNIRLRGRLDGRFWPTAEGGYTLADGSTAGPLVILN